MIKISHKVSIITPTYHRLDSLKEAVHCVLNQTYQNWECLIVSDGYDQTVRDFVRNINDERIKYFHTWRTADFANSQRNYALQHCVGEFILGLDDDNLISKYYLEKMVDAIISENIGYIVCKIKHSDCGVLDPKYPFKLSQIDLLNFIVRRKLALIVGGWSTRYEADFDLINKVSHITKGNYVNEFLGIHRKLELSSHRNSYNTLPMVLKVLLLSKITLAIFIRTVYRIIFLLYLSQNSKLIHIKIREQFCILKSDLKRMFQII